MDPTKKPTTATEERAPGEQDADGKKRRQSESRYRADVDVADLSESRGPFKSDLGRHISSEKGCPQAADRPQRRRASGYVSIQDETMEWSGPAVRDGSQVGHVLSFD